MKLRTTMLTSAFAGLIAVVSCSDDTHKQVAPGMEAGAAGEAGEPGELGEPTQGGGAGGARAIGGMGGGPEPSGGVGGSVVETIGDAGAAGAVGAAAIPAGAVLLFTVDATSTGLASSGVAASTDPQAVIFASSTANPNPITGTNVARINPAELGLADTDAIGAFAIMQPTPSHAVYWFSVDTGGAGAQGERPTRLARSSEDGEALGDVYFSDGTLSFRSLGEGGDQLGYNGLVADEQSLGLSPAAPADGHLDNLTGVQAMPSGQMPSALYFSVGPRSVGLSGTGVATTASADRACTVYKSSLDGQNSVAFTCADLGLTTNSYLKGLVVYGTTALTEVLFAIGRDSTGLAGTAVETALDLTSDIFATPLDGTNTLLVDGNALGLSSDDQLDALAVVDRTPASYPYTTTCNLTPAPTSPDGAGFATFQSAHRLGSDLILVAGAGAATAVPVAAIGAYNVKTCAFVARSAIAPNTLQGRTWTPVPLSGWSAAAPLTKLEYWTLTDDGSSVNRLDSTGAVLASYGLTGIAADTYRSFALDYDPLYDRFYAVLNPQTGFGDYQRLYFAHPAPSTLTGTLLDVTDTPIPHPCAFSPEYSGVDAKGDSVYAQHDTGTAFRVCTLSPTFGEFTDLPFTWTLRTENPNYAVLIPEDALYALFENNAFAIERYALTP